MTDSAADRPYLLIVEDDDGVAELVSERLEEIGCECAAVATGRAAIEALGTRRPSLLVLDYSLPDMRADDILGTEGLPPFIITTGRGDESTAVRLMRAGARDYLIKDFSFLDELPVVVRRVLREIDTELELAAARSSLEARARENEAMLREIHHRVKNNLQVVSSIVRLQTPPEAEDALREILVDIQSRISAMALIHEILYESESLAEVDILAYLEALTRGLQFAILEGGKSPTVLCLGESFGLPIERAVPFGLIANELITNAVKHAFPAPRASGGRIVARVGRDGDGCPFLEVEDDGVGMLEDCANEARATFLGAGHSRHGLGLELVSILSDQLRARIARSRPADGKGTLWRLVLSP